MPNPVLEFHRANRSGNDALFSRAHNAALVLGYFECFPGYGLQPGPWKEGAEYPPEFLTMCSEACVSPKRVVRDIKAYARYMELRWWCVDAPGWLLDPEIHPRRMRRAGLSLSHFSEMRELGRRFVMSEHQELDYLKEAAEIGMSAASMREFVKDKEESENGNPDPEPLIRSRRILGTLDWLAQTAFDNDPAIQRAALLLAARIRKAWGL